jgi:hypothetical protein
MISQLPLHDGTTLILEYVVQRRVQLNPCNKSLPENYCKKKKFDKVGQLALLLSATNNELMIDT